MKALKARVERGRLMLDVPTKLPEGTVVDLVMADLDDDELDDEERAAPTPPLTRAGPRCARDERGPPRNSSKSFALGRGEPRPDYAGG